MFQWAQADGREVLVKTDDGPVVSVDDFEDRLEQEEVLGHQRDQAMESS